MDARVAIESPVLIVLLVVVFAYLIYAGRIAAVLGGFFAASNWIFNADLGPIALLKVFTAVMACTACVAVVRKTSRIVTPRSKHALATAVLVSFWMLFISLKTVLTADPVPGLMLRGFFVYTAVPTSLLLIFINQIEDIAELAAGFVVCATGTAIGAVLIVPTLFAGQLGLVLGLGGGEYLSFSWCLSMGVLFGVGGFLVAERNGRRTLFLAMAAICGMVLVMTAARQSALALIAALAYVSLVVARKHGKVRGILAISVVLIGLGSILYFGTDLGQGVLSDKWNKSDDDAAIRKQYWSDGWNVFLEHPVAGAGLRYMPDETDSAHNALIDILASQGLIGFLFLAAFALTTCASLAKRKIRGFGVEAHLWQTILISILLFTAVHSFASGSMIAEPEFFWVPMLLILLVDISKLEKMPAGVFSSALRTKPFNPDVAH